MIPQTLSPASPTTSPTTPQAGRSARPPHAADAPRDAGDAPAFSLGEAPDPDTAEAVELTGIGPATDAPRSEVSRLHVDQGPPGWTATATTAATTTAAATTAAAGRDATARIDARAQTALPQSEPDVQPATPVPTPDPVPDPVPDPAQPVRAGAVGDPTHRVAPAPGPGTAAQAGTDAAVAAQTLRRPGQQAAPPATTPSWRSGSATGDGAPGQAPLAPAQAASATPATPATEIAPAGTGARTGPAPAAPSEDTTGAAPDTGGDPAVLARTSDSPRGDPAGGDGLRPDQPRAEVARAAGTQLIEAVRHGPNGTTEVALNPEELGRVRLGLTTQDGVLHVSIVAERPETQDMLRRHIATLQTDFRALGYTDVAFDFGPGGDPPPRPSAPAPTAAQDGDTLDPAGMTRDPAGFQPADTPRVGAAIPRLDLRV